MLFPEFSENKEKSMLLYFAADGADVRQMLDELEKTYVCFEKMNETVKDGKKYPTPKNKKIIEKSKKEKLDKIYDEASTEESIITRNANKKIRRLKNALLKLEEIPNYKDSAIRIEKIKKEIEDITRETKIQKEKKNNFKNYYLCN